MLLLIIALYLSKIQIKLFFCVLGLTFEDKNIENIDNVLKLTDEEEPEKFFNENSHEYRHTKWLFDTPGVIQEEQTINLLTSEELLYTVPKQALWPRIYCKYIKIKEKNSQFQYKFFFTSISRY